MLEINNVTRRYAPKKGVPVTALDNLSVKFPEKGMVFLLGKSGSGKSTLLNVMGGLDKCDEGEIIIKGKSSKNFTQGDFDSYRNTYLGFIFQEYNILNEFSVGANIGLALQLQGKKVTEKTINEILEEVDLAGYGQRQPNELSGGQKQRVAIARALVKNPEIILADEPTGALDSNTGLQVFDTLKKLSTEKLVIVVTHDREFAELYGDRVIELKDGKIISDIEKFKATGEKRNDSVNVIDNKIIQIKKGYKLTKDDLDFINSHIENNDTIISIDDKANDDLKKFARIDTNGNREAFKETDESAIIIPEEKNFKLIKSRLPFKHSFKIGASSLKNKPIRLAFTIFLSLVAFAMFGLTDTMGSYNKYKTAQTSFQNSDIDAFSLSKTKKVYNEQYDYTSSYALNSNASDIENLKAKTGVDFKPVYTPYNDSNSRLNFQSSFLEPLNNAGIYTSSLGGFYEYSQSELSELGYTMKGRMPSTFTEIAISEYTFSHFKKFGFKMAGVEKKAEDITSEESFLALNPKIVLNSVEYTITAIIDTKFNYDHFEGLSDPNGNQIMNYILYGELQDTVNYGYHGLVFVKEGFIQNELAENNVAMIGSLLTNANLYFVYSESTQYFGDGISVHTKSIYANRLHKFSQLTELNATSWLDGGRKTVAKNEFMVDFYTYLQTVENELSLKLQDNETFYQEYKDLAPDWLYEYQYGFANDQSNYAINYCLFNYDPDFDQFLTDAGHDLSSGFYDNNAKAELLNNYISQNPDSKEYTKKSYNELLAEYNAKLEDLGENSTQEDYRKSIITKAIKNGEIMKNKDLLPSSYVLHADNYMLGFSQHDIEAKLVGVYWFDHGDDEINYSNVLVDDELYSNMDSSTIGNFSFLVAQMPTGHKLTEIIKFSYDGLENTIQYDMRNGVMSTLNMVNEFIEMLAQIFLYVGIGFAVFAALMLTNFIATSIAYKRREIGILRAVGARSSDVFGIFFNESLLIALINFVLATVASAAVVIFLNNFLRTEYNILITILNFGIRQVALMLGISVLVAFVASFLPVFKVAKQKPVDAIKK
ncbi:MAG TPA: ABC transporter ATP-binding protein/permease [Clostridia bacterium]|nr:ABC transporter ATP-binding protein/permease [Clostridia bacterium]